MIVIDSGVGMDSIGNTSQTWVIADFISLL